MSKSKKNKKSKKKCSKKKSSSDSDSTSDEKQTPTGDLSCGCEPAYNYQCLRHWSSTNFKNQLYTEDPCYKKKCKKSFFSRKKNKGCKGGGSSSSSSSSDSSGERPTQPSPYFFRDCNNNLGDNCRF
ncbi:UNVERIFIED_CONTAM: hypothetical protein RMT77_000892 [Armadillidium vulgare]